MKYFSLHMLLIGVLTCLPSVSQAYFTANQEAFTLDSTVAYYTVSFKFGHEDHDVYIPINTFRDIKATNTALTYKIYDTNKESVDGTGVAIVLSNARVVDGMYKVSAGRQETFTLFASFTPEKIETDGEYRLEVTSLPFRFDESQQLRLNPSELQYYTTKYIMLTK